MSVKAMMAAILQDQMIARGVNSLSPSDYEQIVELLIEQIRKLELSFGCARNNGEARAAMMPARCLYVLLRFRLCRDLFDLLSTFFRIPIGDTAIFCAWRVARKQWNKVNN
ncbi:hypothetical protein [Bradyrhizobium sp. Gha]|uniref:hypothetical protein n=1 Tax=Bradyrhizobium sp. Gha TaxID=1855318 RepID=UPI0008E8CBCE|nr:hypothetical protein [Bradyrhizobium sp. Gha]SFJ59160.1 hypothetical protein SAMN05216525_12928 [Bradyrhizobium sp. Gha]